MVNSRLAFYIRTKGQKLPKDLHKFMGLSKCIFCSAEEASVPVLHYPKYGTTEGYRQLDINCCFTCAEDVFKFETSTLEGPNPRQDMFLNKNLTKEERINEYVLNCRFDDTVSLHYQHYTRDEAPAKEICYFCKNTSLQTFTYIDVPVNNLSSQLVGGKIRCCLLCHEEVKTLSEGLNIDTRQMSSWPHCFYCEKTYPVTVGEEEMRNISGFSRDSFLCPECTYSSLRDHANSPLYHDYSFPDREIHEVCQFCNDRIEVNLHLPYSFIKDMYVGINYKPICTKCRVLDAPAEKPVAGMRINDEYLLLVFENTLNWYTYYIIRIMERGHRAVMYTDEFRGSLIDGLLDVLTGVEDKLIVGPPKQLTL
jgi:hypothetical protein